MWVCGRVGVCQLAVAVGADVSSHPIRLFAPMAVLCYLWQFMWRHSSSSGFALRSPSSFLLASLVLPPLSFPRCMCVCVCVCVSGRENHIEQGRQRYALWALHSYPMCLLGGGGGLS